MNKQERHAKAEDLRRRIAFPQSRIATVNELCQRTCFDEADELLVTLLLKKKEYMRGCERVYSNLMVHLISIGRQDLHAKAVDFYRNCCG